MKKITIFIVLLLSLSSNANELMFGCYVNSTAAIEDEIPNHREFIVGKKYDFSSPLGGSEYAYKYSGQVPGYKFTVSHTIGKDYAVALVENTRDNTYIESRLALNHFGENPSNDLMAEFKINISSNYFATVKCSVGEDRDYFARQ